MISEAMELFQDRVREAAGAKGKVELLDLPGDSTHFMVVKPDGSTEVRERLPQPRQHVLMTIDAVIEYVNWASETLGYSPTVWFDGQMIIVVLDDNHESRRQDQAGCKLITTDTWDLVCAIGKQWLPQKQFVRLLRVDLADAVTESSDQLLRVARVLAFSSSAAGHGNVQHGRESIGRDIEDEVKSEAGDVPDQVSLNVRIFNDPRTTARREVRCAVDINPREGTFNLCPLPGQLDDVIEDQVNTIGGWLDDELKAAVFRGRPD